MALYATISIAAMAEEEPQVRLHRFEQHGKFGFRDERGSVVIQPTYDDADDFACGLAPVNRGARLDLTYHPPKRDGGRWGYINACGEVVIALTLRWACEFSEGLAQVSDEKGRRFIDTQGTTVVTLGEVSHAGEFKEGLAPVHIDGSLQQQDWQTRFIDKNGRTVFTADGYAEEFHEGLALLCVIDRANPANPRYGFIDRTGRVAIAPVFAEALCFSESLAPVRTKKTTVYGRGDTWGYIDKTGKFVLEPTFNEAHPFRSGVARVHVGGALRFDEVHSPPQWEGGEWQLIDRNGRVLKRSKEWVEYEVPAN
jgi:hypothetical protein